MNKSMLFAASALALPVLALAAVPAAAQENASTADTILVTAQKREQAIVDIPQAVSVVSGEVLEQQNAGTFADYLKLVPGLQVDQSRAGNSRLIIRGVNADGVASTVGVYMDETPFGSSSGLVNAAVLAGDFDPFDLERIEVLRGPQGTLYGASSLSGVIRFVSRSPSTDALELRGRVGAETTKGGEMSYLANGVVNAPLSDMAAFRASGSYRSIGGFVDSIGQGGSDIAEDINGSESVSGRASLLLAPSEGVDLRFTAVLQNIDAEDSSGVLADPDTLELVGGALTRPQFVPGFSDLRYRVYNATASFDLGFAELVSSTSYSTQKQDLRTDYTFALAGLIQAFFGSPNEFFQDQQTNSERFTQELRLAGSSGPFDWLLGAYYTDEKGLIDQNFRAVTPGTLNDIPTVPTLGLAQIDSQFEEIAVFANTTWQLTDAFSIDLGGRYSSNDQSALQVTDGALVGGLTVLPEAGSDENVFTWSVAPRFELADGVSLYARAAKGYRPGGPNVLPPGAPAEFGQYESDTVTNWELGLKGETGAFAFDVAAFTIDWDNVQLLATQGGFNFNANGGGAKSEGVEFLFTADAAPGLTFSVNGAFTDTKLTTDTLIGGLEGDALPFTPDFAGAINADYEWDLSSTATARLGGSVRHVGEQSGGFDGDYRAANGEQRTVPSYTVMDLTAGIDFGAFAIDAWVRNLGDSTGRTSTSGTDVFGGFPLFPGGAIATGVIRPRTFGLALSADL